MTHAHSCHQTAGHVCDVTVKQGLMGVLGQKNFSCLFSKNSSACNPCPWEGGDSKRIRGQGHHWLDIEFKASLGYIVSSKPSIEFEAHLSYMTPHFKTTHK